MGGYDAALPLPSAVSLRLTVQTLFFSFLFIVRRSLTMKGIERGRSARKGEAFPHWAAAESQSHLTLGLEPGPCRA
jgi:hypothetical protein